MHRGMLFSPLAASRTHLMVVGVEAAHQLATVGLLLLLKLAEGQREEKKERVCAPAPHGRRVGPRCARGEGGGTKPLLFLLQSREATPIASKGREDAGQGRSQ